MRGNIGLRLLVGIRFQVLFHSPLGVLFTFPSRYWFTIGHQRVFSLGGWSPQIPTGFHVSRGTWDPDPRSPTPLPYRTVTFCGAPFQALQLGLGFLTPRPGRSRNRSSPTTPTPQRLRAITWHRFGLFPFRSPLLGESRLLSLPTGTEMFQFPALASCPYGFRTGSAGINRRGLPHSGIPGLASVCDYPGLIAAYHALHRLLVPRHPPYTLSTLTPRCSVKQSGHPIAIQLSKNRSSTGHGEETLFSRSLRRWWR